MIGGLQGEFGDLDIKYLKQNISKCQLQISGSFRRTPVHCAKWLRNSISKRLISQRCEVVFQLVVFDFQRDGKLQGGNTTLYKKAMKNHLATKG